MRRQARSGRRRVLRGVAVGAVVIVAAGTLGAYLKYRAVYDSITRVTVPSTALGHRPPVYSTTSVHIPPGRHQLTVLSIPRDTMVPVYECDSGPGYTGQQANPGGAVQINSLL